MFVLCLSSFSAVTKYRRLVQFWRSGSPRVWNPVEAFLLLYPVAEGQAGWRYQSEEASPTQFLLGNPSCGCGIKLLPKALTVLSLTLVFVGLFVFVTVHAGLKLVIHLPQHFQVLVLQTCSISPGP